MKPFYLQSSEPCLKTLIAEQAKRQKNWILADAPDPHSVIIDLDQMDFKTPLRLGQVIDQINYELSGRVRFTPHDTALSLSGFTLQNDGIHLTHDNFPAPCALTDKEYLILRVLFLDYQDNQSTGVDRAYLLHHVWGYAGSVETHTIETHMYRLRQKLEICFGELIQIINQNARYHLVF